MEPSFKRIKLTFDDTKNIIDAPQNQTSLNQIEVLSKEDDLQSTKPEIPKKPIQLHRNYRISRNQTTRKKPYIVKSSNRPSNSSSSHSTVGPKGVLHHTKLLEYLKINDAINSENELKSVKNDALTVRLVMSIVNCGHFSYEKIFDWISNSCRTKYTDYNVKFSNQFDAYKLLYNILLGVVECTNGSNLLSLITRRKYKTPRKLLSWYKIFDEIPAVLDNVSFMDTLSHQIMSVRKYQETPIVTRIKGQEKKQSEKIGRNYSETDQSNRYQTDNTIHMTREMFENIEQVLGLYGHEDRHNMDIRLTSLENRLSKMKNLSNLKDNCKHQQSKSSIKMNKFDDNGFVFDMSQMNRTLSYLNYKISCEDQKYVLIRKTTEASSKRPEIILKNKLGYVRSKIHILGVMNAKMFQQIYQQHIYSNLLKRRLLSFKKHCFKANRTSNASNNLHIREGKVRNKKCEVKGEICEVKSEMCEVPDDCDCGKETMNTSSDANYRRLIGCPLILEKCFVIKKPQVDSCHSASVIDVSSIMNYLSKSSRNTMECIHSENQKEEYDFKTIIEKLILLEYTTNSKSFSKDSSYEKELKFDKLEEIFLDFFNPHTKDDPKAEKNGTKTSQYEVSIEKGAGVYQNGELLEKSVEKKTALLSVDQANSLYIDNKSPSLSIDRDATDKSPDLNQNACSESHSLCEINLDQNILKNQLLDNADKELQYLHNRSFAANMFDGKFDAEQGGRTGPETLSLEKVYDKCDKDLFDKGCSGTLNNSVAKLKSKCELYEHSNSKLNDFSKFNPLYIHQKLNSQQIKIKEFSDTVQHIDKSVDSTTISSSLDHVQQQTFSYHDDSPLIYATADKFRQIKEAEDGFHQLNATSDQTHSSYDELYPATQSHGESYQIDTSHGELSQLNQSHDESYKINQSCNVSYQINESRDELGQINVHSADEENSLQIDTSLESGRNNIFHEYPHVDFSHDGYHQTKLSQELDQSRTSDELHQKYTYPDDSHQNLASQEFHRSHASHELHQNHSHNKPKQMYTSVDDYLQLNQTEENQHPMDESLYETLKVLLAQSKQASSSDSQNNNISDNSSLPIYSFHGNRIDEISTEDCQHCSLFKKYENNPLKQNSENEIHSKLNVTFENREKKYFSITQNDDYNKQQADIFHAVHVHENLQPQGKVYDKSTKSKSPEMVSCQDICSVSVSNGNPNDQSRSKPQGFMVCSPMKKEETLSNRDDLESTSNQSVNDDSVINSSVGRNYLANSQRKVDREFCVNDIHIYKKEFLQKLSCSTNCNDEDSIPTNIEEANNSEMRAIDSVMTELHKENTEPVYIRAGEERVSASNKAELFQRDIIELEHFVECFKSTQMKDLENQLSSQKNMSQFLRAEMIKYQKECLNLGLNLEKAIKLFEKERTELNFFKARLVEAHREIDKLVVVWHSLDPTSIPGRSSTSLHTHSLVKRSDLLILEEILDMNENRIIS